MDKFSESEKRTAGIKAKMSQRRSAASKTLPSKN
jgi:hypothetical protein